MSDTTSTWSAERIERLTQLWSEGLSASQIAGKLGGGVSRNAVIGKVHRLGLSPRVHKSGSAARAKRASPRQALADPKPQTLRVMVAGNTALTIAAAAIEDEQPDIASSGQPADIVPMIRRLTLMQLGTTTCRWPIGDPRSPDFRFCGARTAPGAIYCSAHECLAHQPRSSGPAVRPAPRPQSIFTRKSF